MPLHLLKSKFAIIGGGRFCRILLGYLFDTAFMEHPPEVLGVADIDVQAEGLQLARQLGIRTTTDYRELYALDGLQCLLELTMDPTLADAIRQTKPQEVRLMDHIEARSLWTVVQLEKEKKDALYTLRQKPNVSTEVELFFQHFADHIMDTVQARNNRYIEIEQELVRSQWVLSQSIQGSTIPTFVVDEHHRISHWNRALEKLTGKTAKEMVGSRRQWEPFYQAERPSLADVVLDQADEDELQVLYGDHWRKSALIENAFEAEGFFPGLGTGGKWIWFTAAPIKSTDGRILGAIETLWDKTDEKRAEEERERHTCELQTLCKVYSALNDDAAVAERIDRALDEVQQFMAADDLSLFLLDAKGDFSSRYCRSEDEIDDCDLPDVAELHTIRQVARVGEFLVTDQAPGSNGSEAPPAATPQSLVYIPITR